MVQAGRALQWQFLIVRGCTLQHVRSKKVPTGVLGAGVRTNFDIYRLSGSLTLNQAVIYCHSVYIRDGIVLRTRCSVREHCDTAIKIAQKLPVYRPTATPSPTTCVSSLRVINATGPRQRRCSGHARVTQDLTPSQREWIPALLHRRTRSLRPPPPPPPLRPKTTMPGAPLCTPPSQQRPSCCRSRHAWSC